MQILPDQVAGLCRLHAKELQFQAGSHLATLDRSLLLWAFAGVESSWGKNAIPRHEPGYCHGGKYFDPAASGRWGCWAHCSYGPWQVMFANFPPGLSPAQLNPDGDGAAAAELCIRGAVARINLAGKNAAELGDLAKGYNGPQSSDEYLLRLASCYREPMPEKTILSGGY